MHRLLVPASSLLWGLQFSFLGPSLALILTDLFGATDKSLGTVLMIYNAAGFVCSLLIPAAADRKRSYLRPMLVCALLTVAMVAFLLLVHTLPLATLGLVVLGAPAAVGLSMLFAQMRDTGSTPEDVMRTRAFVSFAWVAGQPLATFILGAGGARAVLVLIGVTSALNAVVTLGLMAQHQQRVAAGTVPPVRTEAELPITRWALATVVVAFVALNTSNNATVSVTALLVTDHMHLPVWWAGIALGVAAGLEIPALIILGRLTKRFASMVLVASGCLAAMGYYLAMAFITQPWALIAVAGLKSWGFATMTGVGLTLFQQVIARPGLASGLFNNTSRIGAIIAGPVITAGAALAANWTGVFLLSIAITGVALVLCLVVGAGTRHQHSPRREPATDPAEDAAAELGTEGAH